MFTLTKDKRKMVLKDTLAPSEILKVRDFCFDNVNGLYDRYYDWFEFSRPVLYKMLQGTEQNILAVKSMKNFIQQVINPNFINEQKQAIQVFGVLVNTLNSEPSQYNLIAVQEFFQKYSKILGVK